MEGQTVIPRYYKMFHDWMGYYSRVNGDIDPFVIFDMNSKFKKKNKCQLCGIKTKTFIHHIVPIAKGGANIKENVIEVCLWCHANCHNFRQGRINHRVRQQLEELF